MSILVNRRCVGAWSVLLVGLLSAGGARAGDWPQWGGRGERNMAGAEQGIPADFDAVEIDTDLAHPAKAKNVKWVARIGTKVYGNPVVADGRLFIGTNDQYVHDSRIKRSRGGLLMCLDESTGRRLWQLPIPRFITHDKQFNYDKLNLGLCASPTVEGDRVYQVTNRGEVLCLDVKGLADGNDGPFVDEGQYLAGPGHPAVKLKPDDADIIWRFDMIKQLPVWPQDASAGAALVVGDLVYVNTSNGVDLSHFHVPYPDAPSLIALDKRTGRLVARDDEHIGRRLFHGQWSSPSTGQVNGKTQIFFGAGDGRCYAFAPPDPNAAPDRVVALKKIWSCDCNPHDYKFRPDGRPIPYQRIYGTHKNDTRGEGPSEIIATPVFDNNCVYVAVGQDTRHGTGKGILTCIDATGHGDITATGKRWTSRAVGRTLATASIDHGLLFIDDYSGKVDCFDADSGRPYWQYDTHTPIWGSTYAVDGKVFLGTENKVLWVFKADRTLQVLNRIKLPSIMATTPIAANGVLYVAVERYLYAVCEK